MKMLQTTLAILLLAATWSAGAADWEAEFMSLYELNRQEFHQLNSLAAQGDAKAQTVLGRKYAKGDDTEQNYAQAFKWYQLAAEQDYAPAQYLLARMFRKGRGTDRNYMQAYIWAAMAAAATDRYQNLPQKLQKKVFKERDKAANALTPSERTTAAEAMQRHRAIIQAQHR